jgi:hypothetical protein
MTELSSKARRVLELARHTDDPALEVQRRVERALSARIATGAESSALIEKSSAANFAPVAAKTLVPLGVAAAMVGAGWFTLGPASSDEHSAPAQAAQSRSSQSPSANAVSSSPSTAPVPARAAAPPSVLSPPFVEGSPLPQSIAATPPPRGGRPVALPAAGRIEKTASAPRGELPRERETPPGALSEGGATSSFSREAEPPAPSVEPPVEVAAPRTPLSERPIAASRNQDPLLAETEALRAAQRALRSGDATRALELLHEQERTYAAGSLHEERAAARILALCQAGLADAARASTERFVRRWPRSALRARVISACRAP